jgi:hypothetical protein
MQKMKSEKRYLNRLVLQENGGMHTPLQFECGSQVWNKSTIAPSRYQPFRR